jgi:hypothetical protein
LEDQKKIWLDQKNPFDEINIWLREVFFEKNEDPFAELRKEAEEFDKNFKEESSEISEEITDDES